eukprot:tig00020956_g16522.t1
MEAPHEYAREKAREEGLQPLPVLQIASTSAPADQPPRPASPTAAEAEEDAMDDAASRTLDAPALLERIEQCPWEVEVSRVALLSWRDAAEVYRLAALRKLHAIASGMRSARLAKPLNLSNAPGAALFESYLPGGWRLLWEETVSFSERHQSARDCILLWDLCNHDDAQRRIQDIGRRHRAAARPGAGAGGAPPRDPNEPLRLPRDHGPDGPAAPPVAGPTLLLAALSLGRGVLRGVRERAAALARRLLADRAPAGAAPALAAAAAAEAAAVCADEPTSCALLRLWSRYRAYWEASRGRELLVSGHARQVFLASSPALCREVRSWFARLEEGHSLVRAAGGEAGPEAAAAGEPRLPGRESHELPDSVAALRDDAFPLFVTAAKWLEMLDGSLARPFFARDDAGRVRRHAAGPDSEPDAPLPAGAQALVGGARGGEGEPLAAGGQRAVGYEGFASELWLAVTATKGERNLHPLVAWTEIVSHITGSLASLEEPDGCLSEDDYLALGRGRSRLDPSQRKCVYAIFERYRAEKRRRGLYDRMDAVHAVYRGLAREGYRGAAVHEVLVDEVQDLTQAELWLLFCATEDPKGFFLAGDTAQTVSRGVGFRFADLRALFHHEAKPRLRRRARPRPDAGAELPVEVGVLGLSAAVLDAIEALFEREIDHLARDAGAPARTPTPPAASCELCAADMPPPAEARQVVLVRSGAARSRLPARLQRAIVLTVEESKGLEWGDVLVFNFFRDSALADGRAWKEAARACADAVRAGAAAAAAEGAAEAAAKGFEDLEAGGAAGGGDKKAKRAGTAAAAGGAGRVLASELKHLYTAVSRACTNVWSAAPPRAAPAGARAEGGGRIYEEDEERGRPMLDLFATAGVARPWGAEEGEAAAARPRAAESGPEEWAARGREYLARGLYDAAARAFENARDAKGGERARALGAVARAAAAVGEKPRQRAYREAAGLFAAAGEAVSAARCLYSAGDFAKAAAAFEQAGELALAAEAHEAGGHPGKAFQLYEKMGWLRHALALADRAGNAAACLHLVKEHPDLYYIDRSAQSEKGGAVSKGVRIDRAYVITKAALTAADAGDIAAVVDILSLDCNQKRARKVIEAKGLDAQVRKELARRDQHLDVDERQELYKRLGISISLTSSALGRGIETAADLEATLKGEAAEVVSAADASRHRRPNHVDRMLAGMTDEERVQWMARDFQQRIQRSELCRLAIHRAIRAAPPSSKSGESRGRMRFCGVCPEEHQPKSAAALAAHNASAKHQEIVRARELFFQLMCTRLEEMLQRIKLQVGRLGEMANPPGGARPQNWRALTKVPRPRAGRACRRQN